MLLGGGGQGHPPDKATNASGKLIVNSGSAAPKTYRNMQLFMTYHNNPVLLCRPCMVNEAKKLTSKFRIDARLMFRGRVAVISSWPM